MAAALTTYISCFCTVDHHQNLHVHASNHVHPTLRSYVYEMNSKPKTRPPRGPRSSSVRARPSSSLRPISFCQNLPYHPRGHPTLLCHQRQDLTRQPACQVSPLRSNLVHPVRGDLHGRAVGVQLELQAPGQTIDDRAVWRGGVCMRGGGAWVRRAVVALRSCRVCARAVFVVRSTTFPLLSRRTLSYPRGRRSAQGIWP